jgi:hypothetical protein
MQQQQQWQRQLTAVLLLQVIGNKWDTYLDLLQAEYEEGCVTLRVELLQQPCRPSCCAVEAVAGVWFSHQLARVLSPMHAKQPSNRHIGAFSVVACRPEHHPLPKPSAVAWQQKAQLLLRRLLTLLRCCGCCRCILHLQRGA